MLNLMVEPYPIQVKFGESSYTGRAFSMGGLHCGVPLVRFHFACHRE